jgi:dihydrolipoamide dehydrogenase
MFLAALDKEIDVKFNAPTLAIEKRGNRVAAIYSSGSTKNEVSGQHVLVATGRRPVVPKGLEAVLQLNRGFVPTNDGMETAIPGLFATGDVTGKSTYFHAAVRESLVAAHNIMAGGTMIDYMNLRDIPVAIFTFPPMAYVGITPQLASKIGIRLLEVSYPLKRDVMAQVYDERVGEVRIFVDRDNMRVVGGWVLGEDAPDVINEIALAAQSGLNLKDLAEFAGQHPVPFEDISYAARSAL